MKKSTHLILFLSVYLSLCLLTACASFDNAPQHSDPAPSDESIVCRIIQYDGEHLLLAEAEGSKAEIYRVPIAGLSWFVDGKPIEPEAPGAYMEFPNQKIEGALAEITHGGDILETWPAQFEEVSAINLRTAGFDDRCSLYLKVLEDLWNTDSGLNNGVTRIGMDLSETSLSPAEQAAVSMVFAQTHNADVVTGTFEDLRAQGYITATPLVNSGEVTASEKEPFFYEWEDGCHFSITEESSDNPDTLLFDAQKWRSSLGAYCFQDCIASRSSGGAWGDYSIGSQMIS